MNSRTQSTIPDQAQTDHPAKPQDGSLLLEVVEEQQYINQQENHLPPGSSQPSKPPSGK